MGLPKDAPRCGCPLLVIFTWVSPNKASASDSKIFIDDKTGLRGIYVVPVAWTETRDLVPPHPKVGDLRGCIVGVPGLLH